MVLHWFNKVNPGHPNYFSSVFTGCAKLARHLRCLAISQGFEQPKVLIYFYGSKCVSYWLFHYAALVLDQRSWHEIVLFNLDHPLQVDRSFADHEKVFEREIFLLENHLIFLVNFSRRKLRNYVNLIVFHRLYEIKVRQKHRHQVVLSLPKNFRKTFKPLPLDMKENQIVVAFALYVRVVNADVVIDRLALKHLMAGLARIKC